MLEREVHKTESGMDDGRFVTSWTQAQAIVHEDTWKPRLALAASNFDGVDVLQKPRSFITSETHLPQESES